MKRLKKNSGSTIVGVIVLTGVILLLLTIWIGSKKGNQNLYIMKRDLLQARANARSAVYASLALQNTPPPPKIDSTTITFDDSVETDEERLVLWEEGIEQYGNGEAITHNTPFTQEIEALGYQKNDSVTIRAELGSSHTLGHTSIILCRKETPQFTGQRTGDIVTCDSDKDTKALPVKTKEMGLVKEEITTTIKALSEIEVESPVTIEYEDDFLALSDTLNAPLFIDAVGRFLEIDGKGKRVIIIGDLQISGEATLKDCHFFVTGEVRINNKSTLEEVTIVAGNKVFLADETSFTGNLATLSLIEVYNNSSVLYPSLFVAFGTNKEKSKEDKKILFSINIRDNVLFDGTAVAFGKYGIRTDIDCHSTGIFWSENRIFHRGTHKGLLRTKNLIDIDTASADAKVTVKENSMQGNITYFSEKKSYPLPWFIGKTSLIAWKE